MEEAQKSDTQAGDGSVDFNYQAENPGHDLLDYRYMAIEMTRLSEPGKAWTTVLAGILIMGMCMFSVWAMRLLTVLLGG
ncbi:MAG: hypothetical protein ACJ78Q_20085 [Chloroflexia bacterium]